MCFAFRDRRVSCNFRKRRVATEPTPALQNERSNARRRISRRINVEIDSLFHCKLFRPSSHPRCPVQQTPPSVGVEPWTLLHPVTNIELKGAAAIRTRLNG
jgi:hypothetical protein